MAHARHDNDGLRKVCGCPRRTWPKCRHPWHINVQVNGVHVRKSLDRLVRKRITSKTDAETEFDKLKVRLKEGTLDAEIPPDVTLSAMLERYQRDYLSRTPSAGRTRSQIAVITRVVLAKGEGASAFGTWPVTEIDPAAIWRYRAARDTKTTVSDKDGQPTKRTAGGVIAVNRDLQLLRRAFNWARTALPGQVTRSPFDGLKEARQRPVTKEAPRSRRLQGDEGDRLLAACGASLRPIVECALETGMRRGEILSLQWRDVDLDRQVLVNGQMVNRPEIRLRSGNTKTRTMRVIPVSSRLRPILDLRRHDAAGEPHAPDAYVFGHQQTGEKMTSLKTAWATAMARATIDDFHFHDLRREAASRWLDARIRLNVVSRLLGHATVTQTSTYLACALAAEHDAIEAFDAHRDRLQVFASQVGKGVQNLGLEGTTRDTSPQINPVVH